MNFAIKYSWGVYNSPTYPYSGLTELGVEFTGTFPTGAIDFSKKNVTYTFSSVLTVTSNNYSDQSQTLATIRLNVPKET